MRLVALGIAGIFLLTAPTSAAAQVSDTPGAGSETTRSGVWLGVGMGLGSAMPTCPICARNREQALSGYFRMGGTVTQRILVGLETNAWYRGGEETDQIIGSASVVSLLYPRDDSGLYVKVGLGLTRFEARPTGDDPPVTANTFGVNVGVGYELRATRALSFVPYLNVLTGSFGNLKEEDRTLTGSMNVSLVQFGIGITTH